MANGWSEARRAAQSRAIHRWRPWERSTGPRTAEGKARSSRNAYTFGHRQNLREARLLLARLMPRLEAGDPDAQAEIERAILAGNVELFFRCLKLAEG